MKRVGVVTVRPRNAGDDEAIATLARPSFGQYSRAPGQTVAALIRARGARTLVAVTGERLVGFAVVSFTQLAKAFGPWEKPVLASLDAIAVDATVQGGGVGTTLLAEVERLARAQHAVSINLRTATTNTRAQALFKRAGFLAPAQLSGFYRGEQHALAMTKLLAP